MTRDELLARLVSAGLESEYDEESAHLAADMALLDYINDPEITAAFENINRWYA